jgi:PKD repeat protein
MKSASTQLQNGLYSDGYRRRATKMNEIFSRSLALFFCFATLFLGQSTYAQTKCPTLNCTAGDVEIESVYLGDASGNPLVQSCVPGTLQTAYLYIIVSSNAPRSGLYFSGTLNGQSLSTCFSNELKGQSTRLPYPTTINYTCGTTLTLTDIFLAYNPGKDNFCTENPTGNCNTIVSSKCSRPPPVVVRAPLVANFTPEGSCPTAGQAFQTFEFTTNITGGTAPYTYTFNFGDGTSSTAATTSTNTTVTHTYTSGGSKTVTLSVTDAGGRTDTEIKTITVAPCCSFSATCTANSTVVEVEGCSTSALDKPVTFCNFPSNIQKSKQQTLLPV